MDSRARSGNASGTNGPERRQPNTRTTGFKLTLAMATRRRAKPAQHGEPTTRKTIGARSGTNKPRSRRTAPRVGLETKYPGAASA
jgi:hypothetical protein